MLLTSRIVRFVVEHPQACRDYDRRIAVIAASPIVDGLSVVTPFGKFALADRTDFLSILNQF